MKSISISEFNNIKNKRVIDIRSIEKYNSNHIEGSINITADKLLYNPEKYLNRNDIYYIYCQRGIQSKKICIVLQNKGYNVINIEGGYESWVMSK